MKFNKPPEWGARFHFPENTEVPMDGFVGKITEKMACEMAEKYDAFIVESIANAARAAGEIVNAHHNNIGNAALAFLVNRESTKQRILDTAKIMGVEAPKIIVAEPKPDNLQAIPISLVFVDI